MSFPDVFGPKKQVAQNIHIGRPAGPNLSDLFRLRHMEKMFQQTLDELEQVKTRLSRLEETIASQVKQDTANREVPESGPTPLTPPLPIAELKQLSEMAKRFK
jgi:hypothetical protein